MCSFFSSLPGLVPSCWKMRSMCARSKLNSTIYKGSFNFGNLW